MTTTDEGDGDLGALRARVEELTERIAKLEDVAAIRNLQYAYGYFIDKCLYDETVDLFADDGEVVFLGGRYKGKVGAARLYCGRFRNNFANGRNGPMFGQLLDHPQMQGIIHVSPDRKSGKARFRSMMQAGRHESIGNPRQWFEGGIYENQYEKDGDVWKIKVLNYRAFWHGEFDKGWAYTRPNYVPNASVTFPDDPYGPDELVEHAPDLWPNAEVVPFHYVHPVTGLPIGPDPSGSESLG
ncbi:MAG TPA: nuclear transport factor 2 family protein [Acidimicrobiales bacterium]|nr:nuclear transport factor 2 family protein [Acidimicrobiales bacterium]